VISCFIQGVGMRDGETEVRVQIPPHRIAERYDSIKPPSLKLHRGLCDGPSKLFLYAAVSFNHETHLRHAATSHNSFNESWI